MKQHEWISRCIIDDLEIHPDKDPKEVAREWRQLAWDVGWRRQGRVWADQSKTARREHLQRARESSQRAAREFGQAMEEVCAALTATDFSS